MLCDSNCLYFNNLWPEIRELLVHNLRKLEMPETLVMIQNYMVVGIQPSQCVVELIASVFGTHDKELFAANCGPYYDTITEQMIHHEIEGCYPVLTENFRYGITPQGKIINPMPLLGLPLRTSID
jgi:hypothetical protein